MWVRKEGSRPSCPWTLGLLPVPLPTPLPTHHEHGDSLLRWPLDSEGHEQKSLTGSLGTTSGLQMCHSACKAFLRISKIEKFHTNIWISSFAGKSKNLATQGQIPTWQQSAGAESCCPLRFGTAPLPKDKVRRGPPLATTPRSGIADKCSQELSARTAAAEDRELLCQLMELRHGGQPDASKPAPSWTTGLGPLQEACWHF